MFLNLEQCFPKTGPWTIYGQPESFNWSMGKKLDPKYFTILLRDSFSWSRLVSNGPQHTLWYAGKKYVVNGAFIEKVWETQTRGSTKF